MKNGSTFYSDPLCTMFVSFLHAEIKKLKTRFVFLGQFCKNIFEYHLHKFEKTSNLIGRLIFLKILELCFVF